MKILGYLIPILSGLCIGSAIQIPLLCDISYWWYFLSVPASLIGGGLLCVYLMDRFVWESECYEKRKLSR